MNNTETIIRRLYLYLCVTVFRVLCMWHSPGLTSAGVAAAVTLSPLACATAVLSDPDMAVCWKTHTHRANNELWQHQFSHLSGKNMVYIFC